MLVVSTYFRSLTMRYNYRIITIKIKKTRCRLFEIYGLLDHNNSEAEAQRSYSHVALNYKTERESMRFCLRVIVNEKILNLEKTTSSVLSVLFLIDEYNLQLIFHGVNHQIHYFNVQYILLTNQQSVNGNPDKTGIYQ